MEGCQGPRGVPGDVKVSEMSDVWLTQILTLTLNLKLGDGAVFCRLIQFPQDFVNDVAI